VKPIDDKVSIFWGLLQKHQGDTTDDGWRIAADAHATGVGWKNREKKKNTGQHLWSEEGGAQQRRFQGSKAVSITAKDAQKGMVVRRDNISARERGGGEAGDVAAQGRSRIMTAELRRVRSDFAGSVRFRPSNLYQKIMEKENSEEGGRRSRGRGQRGEYWLAREGRDQEPRPYAEVKGRFDAEIQDVVYRQIGRWTIIQQNQPRQLEGNWPRQRAVRSYGRGGENPLCPSLAEIPDVSGNPEIEGRESRKEDGKSLQTYYES